MHKCHNSRLPLPCPHLPPLPPPRASPLCERPTDSTCMPAVLSTDRERASDTQLRELAASRGQAAPARLTAAGCTHWRGPPAAACVAWSNAAEGASDRITADPAKTPSAAADTTHHAAVGSAADGTLQANTVDTKTSPAHHHHISAPPQPDPALHRPAPALAHRLPRGAAVKDSSPLPFPLSLSDHVARRVQAVLPCLWRAHSSAPPQDLAVPGAGTVG